MKKIIGLLLIVCSFTTSCSNGMTKHSVCLDDTNFNDYLLVLNTNMHTSYADTYISEIVSRLSVNNYMFNNCSATYKSISSGSETTVNLGKNGYYLIYSGQTYSRYEIVHAEGTVEYWF